MKNDTESNTPDAKDILRFIPTHLRAAAAKLPKEKAHTVLELPPEGEGHNAGLIKVAAICFKMGVSFDDTLAHLQDIYSEDRMDYKTAPHRAVSRIWEHEGELPDDETQDKEALPDAVDELLLRFRRTNASGVIDKSPNETKLKPISILTKLFAPDEIINIQRGRFEAGTMVKMSELVVNHTTDIHEFKYLNPSVFKKVEGVPNPLDKDNKVATRCNANVKSRPYMVLEMDGKDDAAIERFTTFALELSNYIPMVLAVETGNKSVHFWFNARHASEREVKTIFALACMHGADKALGVLSQIARMPNVSASDEGRGAQRVLYFDKAHGHEISKEAGQWNVQGFEEVIKKASQLDFYYHASNSKYYVQSNSEAWISLNRNALANQLIRRGFRRTLLDGELLAPVDEIISSIEMDKSIDDALKGASGRHAGYYEENGARFLVLKSPTYLKPRKGDWQTIYNFLHHMMCSNTYGDEQFKVLLGWLSASVKDLRNNGKRRALFTPAQFVHIVGQPNSGKTLLLKHILPAILGGRSADCDDLFSDKGAAFNSDMFQSELLYLDDTDVLQTDHKFRAKLGERIKSFTVGAGGSYHQKFGDKVPIAPWWRFVRMMNEEPTTLATLPPFEDGVVDKLIILRARSMKGGKIDTSKPAWFEPVREQIVSELPAFVHYLLEEHKIDEETCDPHKRYAVKSYLNPDIVDLAGEDSPEMYIVQKIDQEAHDILFYEKVFGITEHQPIARPWEGSANELYSILIETGSKNSQMRFTKTCPSPKVLASQLRNASKAAPRRFKYSSDAKNNIIPKKRDGYAYWRILPACFIDPIDLEVGDCI